ncbi:MAG TPA: TAXI family TRAP transporter solute-binding subunit [Hyphomicrobiaceae bacterium]|nr:TAXI family TRAP transporter solute-binding subunit [Hyphomicrobiaceae bacterium]
MKLGKFALGFATAVALGLGGTAANAQNQFSISTGGTGGVYYPLAGGFANMITKAIPGSTATAEVTGGSVDNLNIVGTGRGELGMAQVDATIDAIKGQGKFKNPLPIRTLAVMYPNVMQAVTTEASGIKTIADLKGKRVSTGSPGSATEVYAFRVIEAAGLDKDKDMTRERLGAAESTNAIKDGKIDAYFFVAGIPTAAITDLANTPGMKLKLIDHADLIPKMVAAHGEIYSAFEVPTTAYKGMDAPYKGTAVWNILMANASMKDDVAYQITKLFMEKQPDLVAVHKAAEDIKMEHQKTKNAGAPFHPGAIKYFTEKGIKLD